jgi:nitrite reductase (cytochrome c-552)
MKRSVYAYASAGIIIVLAAALIGVLVFMKNQPPAARGITPLTEIAEMEPDSSLWGVNFPNQYSTYLKTGENDIRTTYGGSYPFDKLEEDPRLLVLFAGYGFSKEYNEDRGHLHSLQDVQEIKRVVETTPATCYSCKSSNNPGLWAELGPETYFNTLFSDMTEHIDNPIGCANCHEANTMRLVVTNPALEAALEAQGKDWRMFTRQEMRTVVCANCHVEYYFEGGTYLTFPWEMGTRIEDISAYYIAEDFYDWIHPDSGAEMIKMQHPEYELYTADSTHYRAGVACADCHMPYTRDGAAKFSSHNVHSPLLNPSIACGTCHTDVDFVIGRVGIIQNQVYERLIAAEDALLEAIEAIKAAAENPAVNTALLEEARNLHRESQLRWDFIAAENSMGFHNASETLRILGDSADLARQAQLKAVLAVGSSASAAARGQ